MELHRPRLRGERIKEAREIRALTQTRLAELIGVQRQAISSYEKNEIQPSAETAAKLSWVLQVPLDFFVFERYVDESSKQSVTTFRSLSAATKKSRLQATRYEEWFAEIVRYVSNFIEFPTVQLFSADALDFSELTSEDIEKAAVQTRSSWRLGNGPISNLTRLLENNGVLIAIVKLCHKLDAFALWRWQRPRVFLNPGNNSAVRLRFDLAHEVGHIVLHKHVTEDEFENSRLHKLMETQAHRFAAAFLMPAEAISKELFSVNINHLINLKRRWGVSIQALTMRAGDLNIVGENQKSYIFRQLNIIGSRKKEPLDDEIIPERPVLLRRALNMIVKSGRRSSDEIFEDLKIPSEDLQMLAGLDKSFFAREQNVIPLRLKDNKTG